MRFAAEQILGHVSIVTTQLYARIADEMLMREAERTLDKREIAG